MLEQITITGQLEVLSALHIGTGDFAALGALRTGNDVPEAVQRDPNGERKLASLVSTVTRDCDGLPCLPATTLKGCLLSACREYKFTRGLLDELFGQIADQGDEPGQMGRLHFLLARVELGSIPQSLDLPFYNKDQASYILTRVAINRHTGTADDQKLFNQEMVPDGTRFGLRLRFMGTPDEFDAKIKPVLGLLARESGLSFGKGQGLGQGRLKLVSGSLEATHTSFDANAFAIRTKDLPPIDLTQPGASPGQLTWELKLSCPGPYLTTDPCRAGISGERQDPAIKALRLREGQPLLLPSSLLGVLRAKMAWQQALALKKQDREEPCEEVDNPHRRPDWDSFAQLTTTERLFGVTGWRKLVSVEDISLLDDPEPCVLTSVALDRFTGGPLDGALFATQAYRNVKFKVTLSLRQRGKVDGPQDSGLEQDEAAFRNLLASLGVEGLMLGHGVNKGFGWFDVQVREVGNA